MRSYRVAIPVGLAISLFTVILLLLIRHGLHQDAGMFVYPLDDAYIHLSVARNLAQHGVWGITPYAFAGASSSPLWTLLLAGIARVAGVHLLTPLLLNSIAAIALLALAGFILNKALPQSSTGYRTAALCVLVLVMPLPGIALIGMEHVLHSVAILALVALAAWLGSQEPEKATTLLSLLLFLLAFCCGALRYDSCFVIAVVAIFLLMHRRVLLAVGVCLAASIGPFLYGVYSYRHSGIALPFSVVMKSAGAGVRNPVGMLLASNVSALVLLLTAVFFLRMALRAASTPAQLPFSFGMNLLTMALAATILHAEFGPPAWLMRYEAYLCALDLVALAVACAEVPVLSFRRKDRAQLWTSLAIVAAMLPASFDLFHRAHHGWTDIAASLHDRYVEHLSQAMFVEHAMPRAAVIANDIGFLAYYAEDAKILDPLGLGSPEPVQLMRRHQAITPTFVAQWAGEQQAQLAILHTDFPGMESIVPMGWVLVESWCFPHNTVFQNHVQSFYAPDTFSAERLRSQLNQFHDLDPEVVRYKFSSPGATPPFPERGETSICPLIPDR